MLSLVQYSKNAGTAGFEKPQLIRTPVRVHSTWKYRSLVIVFWVHPFLGYRNYELSARIFGVNENTLMLGFHGKITFTDGSQLH